MVHFNLLFNCFLLEISIVNEVLGVKVAEFSHCIVIVPLCIFPCLLVNGVVIHKFLILIGLFQKMLLVCFIDTVGFLNKVVE